MDPFRQASDKVSEIANKIQTHGSGHRVMSAVEKEELQAALRVLWTASVKEEDDDNGTMQ